MVYAGRKSRRVHGNIAGNTQGNEFYLVNAWKTMSKAATTCAVTDIAYYRAGQTETLAAIVNFTNDLFFGIFYQFIKVIAK